MKLPRWFKALFWLGVVGAIFGVLLLTAVWMYFSRLVPDFRTLADYKPAQITRLYTEDSRIFNEYAKERRIYVPIGQIPKPVIEAFLAAEDTSFYNHLGFDPKAILRALLVNVFTDRTQGASTITQQVAKTFLLSSERTITRKIKELILSRRIEKNFSKDEILELYLNQIYLGNGAYGVAAAAMVYFDKTLDELNMAERAMLAGLPKAPSAYNPARNPERAQWRRNVILGRMLAEGLIDDETFETEKEIPVILAENAKALGGDLAADYAEHIRRELLEKFGEDALYTGGLRVHTTLDLGVQEQVETALQKGLRGYDRRHGWRGPLAQISSTAITQTVEDWQVEIAKLKLPMTLISKFGDIALVTGVSDAAADIVLDSGVVGQIPLQQLTWARMHVDENKRGPKIEKASDVLRVGDIVIVRKLQGAVYGLEQLPAVQGAVVVLDVASGAVRAMTGGLGESGGFNRAVQGKRQTGSVFKPFVYTAALETEFTPASIVLDAPVVFRDNANHAWKPTNYTSRIHGPTTLREALENSRNLVTIRLAQAVGLPRILRMVRRFGLDTSALPRGDLTIALGSGTFSLLDVASAFTTFPNMGVRRSPVFIERVQDANGNVLEQNVPLCGECQPTSQLFSLAQMPYYSIDGQKVLEPNLAYQMTSMLQGVVERGTARNLRDLNMPLAGKTGTTNDYKDAWFVGFTPKHVVAVWVGFDNPQSLGRGEAGGRVAAPIAKDVFAYLKPTVAGQSFKIPQGLSFVRVDTETGLLPGPTSEKTRLEVFRTGTAPTTSAVTEGTMVPGETFNPFGLF